MRIAGWTLLRELGRGGFGVVYDAVSVVDGAAAAVKLAAERPGAAERLAREHAALRALGPPFTPRALEHGRGDDGRAYLAMERLDGPSLAARLAATGPLDEAEAVAILTALARTLREVHARGWCHRDLKPENIYLEGTQARLIDFGIAVAVAGADAPRVTAVDSVVGSAEYMAPEQVLGLTAVDARADLYAVGILGHRLLTGRTPFGGAAVEVRAAQVRVRPPHPGVALSVELLAILRRCLAKTPERRFPSAAALLLALEALPSERTPTTPPPRREPPEPSEVARPTQRIGVVGVAGAASASALGAFAERQGCQLLHVGPRQSLLLFEAASFAHPARSAVAAARALATEQATAVLSVDLVFAQPGPGQGAERHRALALSAHALRVEDGKPGELFVGEAVATALPELAVTPAGARWWRAGTLAEPAGAIEPPLRGRDAELAQLVALAGEALGARRTTLATLVGRAGVGKTRLLCALGEAITTDAVAPRCLLLEASASNSERDLAATLLRRLLTLPERTDDPRRLLGALLGEALADDIWIPLAIVLGWIDPAAQPVSGLSRSVSRALALVLGHAAAQQPLVLLVDDAEAANDRLLDALVTITQVPSLPLFVCVTAQPSLLHTKRTWDARAERRLRLALDPLASGPAQQLCRDLLQPVRNPPARAVERLVERSEGRPLWLLQLVRGLVRDGLVRRHSHGGWYVVTDLVESVPDSPLLQWLAARDVAMLPSDLLEIAQIVAAFGRGVSEPLLEDTLDALEGAGWPPRLAAGPALRELAERGILIEVADRWQFAQASVREHLYAQQEPELRARLHAAACVALRASPTATAAELAPHADGAGEKSEAARLYANAAREAAARHLALPAEQAWSRALALLPDDAAAERFAAHRGRGQVRHRLGRFDDALSDLTDAIDDARRFGDARGQAEALLDRAAVYDWMSDYPRAEADMEAARIAADGCDDPGLRMRLAVATGRALCRVSRWAEALPILEDAAARAAALGPAAYEERIDSLIMVGWIHALGGRTAAARSVIDGCLDDCRRAGDQLHALAALQNRLLVCVGERDAEGAVADQEQALALARELGMGADECYVHRNLAELHLQRGALGPAWEQAEAASSLARLYPSEAGGLAAELLKARILVLEGERARARAQWHDARAAQPEAPLAVGEQLLADLIELATRDADEADWRALVERVTPEEHAEVLEVWAREAWRRGDLPKARARLDEALAVSRQTASFQELRIAALLASWSRGEG